MADLPLLFPVLGCMYSKHDNGPTTKTTTLGSRELGSVTTRTRGWMGVASCMGTTFWGFVDHIAAAPRILALVSFMVRSVPE